MVETCNRSFDIADSLPDEYRDLLVRMLTHEGERTGNNVRDASGFRERYS